MRTYTQRRFDDAAKTLAVDFVLHGDGPAATWAAQAHAGQQLILMGPARSYVIDPGASWYVLAVDDTALPALETLLEALPAGARVTAFIGGCRGRRGAAPPGSPRRRDSLAAARFRGRRSALEAALAAYPWETGDGCVYVGCEADAMRRIRAMLLASSGVDRSGITTAAIGGKARAITPTTTTASEVTGTAGRSVAKDVTGMPNCGLSNAASDTEHEPHRCQEIGSDEAPPVRPVRSPKSTRRRSTVTLAKARPAFLFAARSSRITRFTANTERSIFGVRETISRSRISTGTGPPLRSRRGSAARPGDNLHARMFLRDSDLKQLGIDCASVLGASRIAPTVCIQRRGADGQERAQRKSEQLVAERVRAPGPDFDTETAFEITPAMRAPLFVAPEPDVAFAPEPPREPVCGPRRPTFRNRRPARRRARTGRVRSTRARSAAAARTGAGRSRAGTRRPRPAPEPSAARKTVASPTSRFRNRSTS